MRKQILTALNSPKMQPIYLPYIEITMFSADKT